ncbi:MAG: M1 family metallopeptidase [Clostridia bacterium]|nr:M1 family metallopeptidase [Clostridia bacterium]
MSLLKNRLLLFLCIVCVLPIVNLGGCKKSESLSSYSLNATYHEGALDGKLRYKFVNRYDTAFDHVDFNLHANAYCENSTTKPVTDNNLARAYPNGLSYGGIEILKVEILNQNAEFDIFGDSNCFLRVKTPTVYQGETVEIDIAFKTSIPNSKLRLGENAYAVNLADFFPTACYVKDGGFLQIPYSPFGDPYLSEISDYSVNLTVPSEFTVASCGKPTQTLVEELTTTYSYELKSARDFAFVLSKDFKVFSQNHDDVTVNYYSFSDDGESYLKTAISALEFFSKNFGDYPYQTLSLAETGFLFGGMEFSSLCYISTELEKEEKQNAIAHEIAHQWWHGGVSNDQYNSAYIDEGLAEFSAFLFFENSSLELANEMISNAKHAYKSFFDLQSVLSGNVDTTMERPLSTFKSEYEYANLSYNKSLLMFYEYYSKFGKNKTLSALKKLYSDNYGREITRAEIIKAFGRADHFNSFVDGKVII